MIDEEPNSISIKRDEILNPPTKLDHRDSLISDLTLI